MISYHLRRVSGRAADERPAGPGPRRPRGCAAGEVHGLVRWWSLAVRPPSSRRRHPAGVPLPAKMATIASFIAVPTVAPNSGVQPELDVAGAAAVASSDRLQDRVGDAGLGALGDRACRRRSRRSPSAPRGSTMYLRNSTHSGRGVLGAGEAVAATEGRVGSPAAPATAGNGNQPRKSPSCFLSGVDGAHDVPPSQWPMSSIAALPLASRPAELVGAVLARRGEEVRAGTAWCRGTPCRSSPALTKHGSSKFCSAAAFFSASGEQSRSAKLYHQCAAGHLSPAPTAIGMTSSALSLATRRSARPCVVGGAVMPACVNRSLLYQKPSMPKLNGRPYCLPSTCQMLGRGADVGDLGLGLVGDVLEVAGLPPARHLAAAPRLEDVRRVVAQQRGRDLGALQLVGLDRRRS